MYCTYVLTHLLDKASAFLSPGAARLMLRPSAEEYAAYADDYAKFGATAQAGAPAGRPGDPEPASHVKAEAKEAADALQLVARANHEEAQAAYAAQQEDQLAATCTAP